MIVSSSAQKLTGTKIVVRKRLLMDIARSQWTLPLILVFQALLSWAVLQNTVFQDEALYVYAGRQIWQSWLSGEPLMESYSYYFSGYPYIFPLIAGGLDMLGGLELVRWFNTVWMLAVTACGYYVTRVLFNQKSAVFATLFFACQGPVLFLARLATYDALCICMVAVGMALAVKASQARKPWLALGIGPCLVLAFGAKYGALLFIPSVLAVLALSCWLKWGWKSMLLRGTLAVVSLASVGSLAALGVLYFDPNMLHALHDTTTNRVMSASYPRLTLTTHIIEMAGLSYGVALIGLLFARRKLLLIGLLFFGSSLLIPAYHIYKAEMISLDKHLGFAMFFAMPVAGYALASLSGFGFRKALLTGRYWLAGVALSLILFLVGIHDAHHMYTTWPSSAELTKVLKTQIRPINGRYLMEQYEVVRYNLQDHTYIWQWTGLDFFKYTDPQGNNYSGRDAYVKAVNNGYFDLIQLNYGYNKDTARLITQTIEKSNQYELIARIPNQTAYGTGHFWIWRKR